MDKTYDGDETRHLVVDLGMESVIQSKRHRLTSWEYTREMYSYSSLNLN